MSAASVLIVLIAFAAVIPIGVGVGWVHAARRRRWTPFGVEAVAQEAAIFGLMIAVVAIVVQLLAGSPIAIAIATALLGPICTLAGVSTFWRKRWKPEDRMSGERGIAHRERWTIRQTAAMRRRGGGTGPWGLIGPTSPWPGVERLWEEINEGLGDHFANEKAHTARVGVRMARPHVDDRDPEKPWPVRPVLGPKGNPVVVSVPVGKARDGRMGAAIGGTGGGKTTTVTRIILAMAELHRESKPSVVIIDPKGDPALERTARQVAALLDLPFRAWGPQWPTSRLDPLHTSSGRTDVDNNARMVSRLLASFEWSESFYESRSRVEWTRALTFAHRAGEPITFERVARLMSRSGLRALSASVRGENPELAKDIAHQIEDVDTQKGWNKLADLASRLEGFAVGGYAPLFGAHEHGVPSIGDLLDAPGVVYLRLDVAEYPNDGPGLVELLLTGLTQDSALLDGRPGVLFLDELSAAPADRVVPLLDRGRSAGWNVILGAQTLSGLDSDSDELRAAILGDCSWISVHGSTAQDARGTDDAERLAKVIGTRAVVSRTHQVQGPLGHASGMGSAGAAEEFIVNPSIMRGLARGQAVIVQPREPTTSTERAQLMSVVAPRSTATFPEPTDAQILGAHDRPPVDEEPPAADEDELVDGLEDELDDEMDAPTDSAAISALFGPPDLDDEPEDEPIIEDDEEPEGRDVPEESDAAGDDVADEEPAPAPPPAAPARSAAALLAEPDDDDAVRVDAPVVGKPQTRKRTS